MIADLTKSIMRLPLDLSAKGLKYLAEQIVPDENLEDSVGRLVHSAVSLSDMVSPGLAMGIMREAASSLDELVPGDSNRLALLEFQNKLEAFGGFEYVRSMLDLSPNSGYDLADLVGKAQRLEPYERVWATEGSGHLYAETYIKRNTIPKNLLTEESLSPLPPASLITLHAGMGLSLANRVLASVPLTDVPADLGPLLKRFLAMCRQNSRDGYAEITIEALGLVARTLYPGLVHHIDRHLSEHDLDTLSLFWHGVGRGLYFIPMNFLPYVGSAGRAIEMAVEEAPHSLGRRNAIAGIAWPLTLVNIRHPEIMENFLASFGNLVQDNDAFSQGVSTAAMTWFDSVPEDPNLEAFRAFRPDGESERVTHVWDDLISRPLEAAIGIHYPVLKAQWRLGEIFRYQPLSRIAARLQSK